jgi:outer membrane receptor for ferrienterochelin and colicin
MFFALASRIPLVVAQSVDNSPVPGTNPPPVSTSQSAVQRAVVSGLVSEAASGESVIGINVILATDSVVARSSSIIRGTRTNKFGFYSLPDVPPGSYFLVVRGVGYRQFAKRIAVGATPVRENIALGTQNVRSQEVTVQAEREASPTRSISTVALNMEFAKKMPVLGGESDIFRVLQLMPGIKAASELSSGLYVRGGSPDQNLILLDGVVVYNPSHLAGFLSTFNSDAIRDVRVIKGAFPAEYGGRLSSVIDLTMKEGSKEKFSGTGNLGLIASRLTLEGPITPDVSFMVSGRRTYFDAILALLPQKVDGTYYFYDLNTKLNWNISENDRLFVSGYFGRDVADAPISNAFKTDWGNATANLRWMHIVSPSLFTNFSAIYTDYQFSLGIPDTTFGFSTLSRIRDFTARGDAQWFPDKQHTIKTGVDVTYHNFTTLISSTLIGEQLLQSLGVDNGNASIPSVEASVYAQDEWQDAFDVEGLSLNAGLRLAYFQLGSRLLPEPRLSAVYNLGNTFLGNNFKLKGAFAVANQFLHLVVRNDITLPTDTWFPATETIKPANSTQYVLGAETTIFDNEVLVSVEGYYKSMNNLLEFKENAGFNSILTTREQDLTVGKGESYGMEVFINKQIGSFTGWIGYTLSWTTRQFDELNNGKTYFPRYDSRHDVSVTLNYKLSDSWELGASWVFQSGQAFTMPSGRYFSVLGNTSPTSQFVLPNTTRNIFSVPYTLFTERNGGRLPAYHRLDVNFTHYFSWFGLPFNLSLNVYNAYNRWNPFTWSLRQNYQTGLPEIVQTTIFPIIPNVSIGFKF